MQTLSVRSPTLLEFLSKVLKSHFLSSEAQTALIIHLVEANLCGIDSHGLQQIIGYDKSLKSGRINPKPQIKIISQRPSLIRIDADAAPGQYAAKFAMEMAIEAASKTGIAVVGVTNSNHFGVAGYYTRMATEAGMIGFATTDTNAVDLAPFGGKVAKLGNNAISWGIPTGTNKPVIIDMAAGAVSGGKVKHFAYQDLEIPLGWGITAEGKPTNNPWEVAVNIPASYKGSGLAFISDLLCGPLLGTTTAMFKNKAIHDAANGTGHLLWVLDVAAWTDRKQFEQEVQKAISSLKATPRIQAEEPIYYPGELEVITREERLQTGIPVPLVLVETLTTHFGQNIISEYFR
ncbi:Ldh family oxidoreductase [Mastigocoleus testarum]|uniref:Malate dehydrogenase n=1 Tax=Mastigocoleus testarum BC008 TaxID=371196 RepID=A0A0V7ZE61_9CYAN|nr:Ldh family oxidoreductase [Mastigocoleus testarum]KST62776.1 malate dehydrogenase [Mastigocoleus testarum BC008]KST65131.1 malate dehydrogenase [Mastigocoleus testarum BC008]